MNTTDKNTLIAEFMGVPQPIKNSNGVWEYMVEGAGLVSSNRREDLNRFLGYNYNNDWGLLMEVTEKIETTSYKVPESFQRGFMKNTLNATGYITSSYDDRLEFLGWTSYCELGTKTIWDSTMLGEDVKRYSSKIEAVYNACIAFIEWYNEQNKV